MRASRQAAAVSWLPWILVAVGLITYSGSMGVPFLFDDVDMIEREPMLRRFPPRLEELAATNRPVLKLSLAANFALGELRVGGYHAVNLAIHLSAGLALLGILRRTLARLESPRPAHHAWAFFGALLWLVHPLQTESVTYTIQRSESLMGMLVLLSLYSLIRAAEGGRARTWSACCLAALLLALGTKEVAAVAPALLLLYDRAFLAGSFRGALAARRGLYGSLGALALGLGGVLIGRQLFLERASAGFAMESVGPLRYALTQPEVILHYLRLSFWPDPLCIDYRWPLVESRADALPAAALLGVLVAATLWACVRRPPVGFLGAWFLLLLAPTSSFMPIEDAAVEHRMYLPLAAVIVAALVGGRSLAAALGPSAARGKLLAVVGCVAALALASTTARRNAEYRDPVTIWTGAVEVVPHNFRAHLNLAHALLEAGRLDECLARYQLLLERYPDEARVHRGLGDVHAARLDFPRAVASYRRAVELDPDDEAARANLGLALFALDRMGEAVEELAPLLDDEAE